MTIAQVAFLAALAYGGSLVALITAIRIRRGDFKSRRDGPILLATLGVTLAVGLIVFLPSVGMGAVASIVMLGSGLGLLTRLGAVAPGSVGLARLAGWLLVASGVLILLGTIVALAAGGR